MKKGIQLSLLVITLLLSGIAKAQHKHCYTDEATHEVMVNNPEALLRQNQLEEFTQAYSKANNANGQNKVQGVVYVIPIVFHVLHTWGPENISDEQIYDAVRILNRDFRKQNADTIDVVPSFQGIVADCEIEFRLAQIDPNGNCTNGIVRYYDPRTVWDRSAANNNGWDNYTHTWDPTNYLNVYIVKSIDGTAAAYTYKPGTWPTGSSRDAIVCLHDYLGSIGSSSPNNSRTLTHEVGHWFNLSHTWGNNNSAGVACGDDNVFDTPETKGSNLVCNLSLSDCNPPIIENVQNYMDYSYCNNMYTEGQKTRMRSALMSSISGRNNLWSATNLTATGTGSTSAPACLPQPYVNSALRTVCEGGIIAFNHISMNLDTNPAPTFLWNFPGGTPSSSTLENPSITYNTAGHYDVSLTITNSAGSNTVTYTNMVSVYSTQASVFTPYTESFEAITFPGTDFDIDNMNQGNTWTQTTNAAATGTKSVYINNWNGNFGTDVFVTPSYSFSIVSSVGMTFKVAFARRSANSDDKLQVYGSTNCGQTWVQRYVKQGAALATTTTINNFSAYIPTAAQWRTESVTIGSYANQPNVRFKFVYTYSTNGNYGNNIYVDDINFTGTVGIDENFANQIGLSVFPNPSQGNAELTFDMLKQGNVEINVLDVVGRNCAKIMAGNLQAGSHSYKIGEELNAGIYFVELVSDGKKATQKLII